MINKQKKILKNNGYIEEALKLSITLNKLNIELTELFRQNRTLTKSDINRFILQLGELMFRIEIVKQYFGISNEEIGAIYKKILELEYERVMSDERKNA